MTPAGIAPSATTLFGPAWAERLERELKSSEPFRSAAAGWKGSLVLVLDPEERGADLRAVLVDLAHGGTPQVRPALPRDFATASFRVDGPGRAWRRLLNGDLDPSKALAGGELRLVRGSFFALLSRLAAAKELFRCAQRVPLEPDLPTPPIP